MPKKKNQSILEYTMVRTKNNLAFADKILEIKPNDAGDKVHARYVLNNKEYSVSYSLPRRRYQGY